MTSPDENRIRPPAEADSAAATPESGGDGELSFEALGQTFAKLIEAGEGGPAISTPREPSAAADKGGPADESPAGEDSTQADHDEPEMAVPASPRGILEAVLFVGHAENHPLTSRQAAALMRGVSPREVDELVVELNAEYDREQHPYRIESAGAGYRLSLRDDFAPLRDKLYGRVRGARLSQAAIDVLAIVAYNQPTTRSRIEHLRGKACGGILSQLVRRRLLQVERPDDRKQKPSYRTTTRFLKVFGLESLQDLPQSQDFDRAL